MADILACYPPVVYTARIRPNKLQTPSTCGCMCICWSSKERRQNRWRKV